MAEESKGAFWELMQLTGSRVSSEVWLAKALEAKEEITEAGYEAWRHIHVLDNLVETMAPGAAWTTGWARRDDSDPPPVTAHENGLDRSAQVLNFADQIIATGAKTVLTKVIAESLARNGEGNLRDLAVSAGNVLARSDKWRRVIPGKYAPIKK